MRKRQRLVFILAMLFCLALATGLSLYALRQNLSYFMTPSDIAAAAAAQDPRIEGPRELRLGGLVKNGSLKKTGDAQIHFIVTDGAADIAVDYKGLLPDLFREGQGVVATGRLQTPQLFVARELLAKHDEKYMPPQLKKSLDRAHAQGVEKMGGAK